jgi:hypothetical protein
MSKVIAKLLGATTRDCAPVVRVAVIRLQRAANRLLAHTKIISAIELTSALLVIVETVAPFTGLVVAAQLTGHEVHPIAAMATILALLARTSEV